jgi:hypothetical protein
MDIDKICNAIIASGKFSLVAHIKSELEKFKIRDLKELGADSHYNYTANIADTTMDSTDPLLAGKPEEIRVIFRMTTPRYINHTIRKRVVKTRVSESIWYITDRGMIIERFTSYVDNIVFLQYIRYNHTIDKNGIIKSYKIEGSGLWDNLMVINNSLPPLPRHIYNIFADGVLARFCMQFNPYNIDISIDNIPIYLAELARNAAKSPHIDELLLSNVVTAENEKMLALLDEKKMELDKYRDELIKERAELDAELEKFRKLKKRILDKIDDDNVDLNIPSKNIKL